MADDNTTTEAVQVTAEVQPQAGNPDGQAPEGTESDEIKKLRAEAASWRVKHQQLNKKLEAYEGEKLSDLEKLQKQLEQAQAERDELNARIRTAETVNAAAKAGALYPDAVAKLVPADADDVDDAIKGLRKQYPGMFKQQTVDGGAGNTDQPRGLDMNAQIRRAAGRH